MVVRPLPVLEGCGLSKDLRKPLLSEVAERLLVAGANLLDRDCLLKVYPELAGDGHGLVRCYKPHEPFKHVDTFSRRSLPFVYQRDLLFQCGANAMNENLDVLQVVPFFLREAVKVRDFGLQQFCGAQDPHHFVLLKLYVVSKS